MSGFECITLDDSDEEGSSGSHQAGGVHGVQPLVGLPGSSLPSQGPKMVRCNLCVDPGLLPVETDRAKHRYVGNVFLILTEQ